MSLFLGQGSGIAVPPGSVRTLNVTTGVTDLHPSRDPTCAGIDDATSATRTPSPGSVYFIVVPLNESAEGSYGTTSAGLERSPGSPACRLQQPGGCR